MEEDEVFQENVTLDLTGCNRVWDFWNLILDSFDFQPHFGKNWDAFWDMISMECPAHKVTVIGANTLPKAWICLDGQTYSEKLRRILQKNKEFKARYHYEFDYEFIDVQTDES